MTRKFRKWYNAVDSGSLARTSRTHGFPLFAETVSPLLPREQVYNRSNSEGISRDWPRCCPRSIRVDAFFPESNSNRQSSQPPPITSIDNAVGGEIWKDGGFPPRNLLPIHCRRAVLSLLIVKRFAAGGRVFFVINDPSLHNAR